MLLEFEIFSETYALQNCLSWRTRKRHIYSWVHISTIQALVPRVTRLSIQRSVCMNIKKFPFMIYNMNQRICCENHRQLTLRKGGVCIMSKSMVKSEQQCRRQYLADFKVSFYKLLPAYLRELRSKEGVAQKMSKQTVSSI